MGDLWDAAKNEVTNYNKLSKKEKMCYVLIFITFASEFKMQQLQLDQKEIRTRCLSTKKQKSQNDTYTFWG